MQRQTLGHGDGQVFGAVSFQRVDPGQWRREGNNSINTFKPEKIKGFHRRVRRVLYLRRFLVTNPEPVAAAGLFAIGTVKIGS